MIFVRTTGRRPAPVARTLSAVVERPEIAPGEPYQVRFGFTRIDLLLLPASMVFIAVGVLMFRREPVTAVGAIAMGGAYVVLRLANVMNRRVDVGEGTLGMTPPWPSSKTAKVPWSDIEAIVLWAQRAGPNTIRYIGLRRRSGLAPLPG